MNDKISIIICTYNSGEITRRAIESVLNQNYNNFECIVVDGASTDGTADIIKSYSTNSKFRYISEPDSGIFNAMNKGWQMADGDWIYYLGADDELLPNGLSDLFLQAKDSNSYDIIYGNIMYRRADGTKVIHHHKDHKLLPMMMFACHQGMIMRRSLMKKLGGFDESIKILGDKELVIRTYYLKDCRYKATEACVAVFMGGGASSSYWKCFKEDFKIIKKLHPGLKYILYVLQHYPRMWFKTAIGKI